MKLSLTTKIFLAFGFTLATFALLALFSVQEFRAMGEDLRGITEGHLVLARLAGQLETHQQNRFRDLRRGLAEPDAGSREVILRIARAYFPDVIRSRVEEVREIARRQIARLPAQGRSDARSKREFYETIVARIERIGALHENADELSDALLAKVREGGDLSDLAAEVERLEASLRGEVYQLNKHIDDETDRAVRRAERDERHAILRVTLMTALALLVGMALTWLSARALRPIQKLVAFSRAISRGEYDYQPNIGGGDELSELADELRLMSRSLKDREAELDRQREELERAYHFVADLKRYHESVVQSLKTAVIVTDRELVVTGTNRAVETSFGILRDHARGRALPDLPIGAKLVERLGPLARLVEEAETAHVASVELGEKRFDGSIVPFRNERGAVLGLVVALEDVTEAVRTKEALIRSERLAAIGRMSAHVTHEIRNPLSSIGLNAELLESVFGESTTSSGTEEAQALCRAIIREVDRLTAITDEYLRFARLPRPELRPEDPGRLLRSIATFVQRDCQAARIELAVDLDEPLPKMNVDPDQLRQAILNLVRNAKESMPEGGRLVLSAKASDSELGIAVSDTGVGIGADALDRIFDPFYSTKLTGTGLGLALVQQIVNEHGARLEVRSARGQGSEFRIVVPILNNLETTSVLDEPRPLPRAAEG